jgi:hypothetical protein
MPLLDAQCAVQSPVVSYARTAFCAAMLDGPPRLGIQKKPLVSRPSSAALVSALQQVQQLIAASSNPPHESQVRE